MTSIRLPIELESKLDQIAESEHTTKSNLIREALSHFIETYYKKTNPFALGQDLFGRFGSGETNRSKNYKEIIGRNLRDKFSN